MTDEFKKKIKAVFTEHMEEAKKRKVIPKSPKTQVNQTATGHGNIQAGGDINIKGSKITQNIRTQKVIKKTQPGPGSIGANSLFLQRILGLFNELGEERKKRYGDSGFGVMYKHFMTDFKISKKLGRDIYQHWPENMAPEIIQYLQDKLDNTIGGRIKKAARKQGYQHTRPQLYARETELLEHLGMTKKSPELRTLMKQMFGVESHADLPMYEHQQLVAYLDGLVRKMFDE